jgi:small GTP-binding protein
MNPKTLPRQSIIKVYPRGPILALVGNPNCGKTALFNQLTGGHQKVANYAGVTVERKEGKLQLSSRKTLRILDLPGVYSLSPRSPDERVTVDVLAGRANGEKRPDQVICVVDATQLRRTLALVLAVQRQGLPCIVALNKTDLADKRGLILDTDALSRQFGVPFVKTNALNKEGVDALLLMLESHNDWPFHVASSNAAHDASTIDKALAALGLDDLDPPLGTTRIDHWVLHPFFGPVIFAMIMFAVFQAVFVWAEAPMTLIRAITTWLTQAATEALPRIWKRFVSRKQAQPLMMELPNYHWPTVSNIGFGLLERAKIFMRRIGGIILLLTIALWFLSSVPGKPLGATGAAIEYSIAGTIGRALSVIFEPIGFNWQISIALVPGMAAREVAVSSLATVYALSAEQGDVAQALSPILAKDWSMATALSLLAWYVFAPQCLSTLATVKRETGRWLMPLLMAAYLFTLAYAASFVVYRLATALI